MRVTNIWIHPVSVSAVRTGTKGAPSHDGIAGADSISDRATAWGWISRAVNIVIGIVECVTGTADWSGKCNSAAVIRTIPGSDIVGGVGLEGKAVTEAGRDRSRGRTGNRRRGQPARQRARDGSWNSVLRCRHGKVVSED